MSSRLEAYLYSEGSKTVMESTSTITAGGADAILSGATVFADALASLQTQLGGAYSVAWNSTINAVTISNSGTFTLTFTGNMHQALGFSTATGYTGADTYNGDQQALGRYDVLAIECALLTDGAAVDHREWRHARAEVLAFGNCDLFRTRIYMSQAEAASFLASYCAAGRVRLYPDSDTTTAWSATNPAGYVDGYVVALSDLETAGFAEEVVAVSMAIARPR